MGNENSSPRTNADPSNRTRYTTNGTLRPREVAQQEILRIQEEQRQIFERRQRESLLHAQRVATERPTPVVQTQSAHAQTTTPIVPQTIAQPQRTSPVVQQQTAHPQRTTPIVPQTIAQPQRTSPVVQQQTAHAQTTTPIVPQTIAQPQRTSTTPVQQQTTSAESVVFERPASIFLQSPSTSGLGPERSHTYSDLRSQNPSMNLYPNLNNLTITPPSSNSRVPVNNASSSTTEFGFFNNNQAPKRVQPSAPPQPRGRSVPRPNTSGNERNCRTCGNTFGLLKIFQCVSGHSSCETCRTNQSRCGVCGLEITAMRNIPVESLIMETLHKCPNASDGCKRLVKLVDLEAHTNECQFNEMVCPMSHKSGACNWRGKLPQLSSHFYETHPDNLGYVDTEMQGSGLLHANRTVYLVILGNFYFLFYFDIGNNVSFSAQLIGKKHIASKWNYEVHVYSKSQPRRKYQYIDVCTPASESIDLAMNNGLCASLPLSYAMTFVNGGVLTYKFYIKQHEESVDVDIDSDGQSECGGARRPGRGARGAGRGARGAGRGARGVGRGRTREGSNRKYGRGPNRTSNNSEPT